MNSFALNIDSYNDGSRPDFDNSVGNPFISQGYGSMSSAGSHLMSAPYHYIDSSMDNMSDSPHYFCYHLDENSNYFYDDQLPLKDDNNSPIKNHSQMIEEYIKKPIEIKPCTAINELFPFLTNIPLDNGSFQQQFPSTYSQPSQHIYGPPSDADLTHSVQQKASVSNQNAFSLSQALYTPMSDRLNLNNGVKSANLGSKRFNSRRVKQNENPLAEEKRKKHNELEKFRRKEVSQSFQRLSSLVCEKDSRRISKAVILSRAKEYIDRETPKMNEALSEGQRIHYKRLQSAIYLERLIASFNSKEGIDNADTC